MRTSACSSSSSEAPATPEDTGSLQGDSTASIDTTATDTAVPTTDSPTTPDTANVPDSTTTTDLAPLETAATDTWASYAQGFASKYCVECHASTSTTRNYATFAHVKRDMAKIRCGVATTKLPGCGSFPPPKQFPIDNAGKTNPKPTDAERNRFIAWINAGLPE